MKKALPTLLLAPLVCSCLVTVFALQGSEQQATGAREVQGASLSASTSTAPRAKSAANDIPGDLSVEAQRHYNSAMSLSDAGKFDEAIAAFKQSLKLKPEDPQTNFGRGLTYSKSKSYKEAFDYFKRAVRYKPEWAEAHFRLGMISYVLGKRTQSLDEYKKLVELQSPLATVLFRIIKDETATAEVVGTMNGADLPGPATQAVTPAAAVDDVATKPNAARVSLSETSGSQPSEVYRVGIGDVLDVRFLNSANSRSTLFTVISGGVIDLPIAGGSIPVAGLTVDEIQVLITNELKRRAVLENAQVSVGVRQYTSHSVMITGLVVTPGTRFLRRDAVPLYAILAESQLRNDAGRVQILRSGTPGQSLDLTDSKTLNLMIQSGDVITVSGRPQEFYYIAGRINYPGQKTFQPGITLLQAILAAGGTTRQNENLIEISREGSSGRLVTTRYNIKLIKAGTVEDPKLQAGDRIEVMR